MNPLIAALNDYNKHLRREAAIALGLIGDAAAVDSLTRLLTHPDKYLRRNAAKALIRINDPRSAHPLIGYILNAQPFFWEEQLNKIADYFRLREVRSWAIILRDNYNWRQ